MKKRYIDAYSHYCPSDFLLFLGQYVDCKEKEGFWTVFYDLFVNNQNLIDIEVRIESMKKNRIERSVLVPLPWIEIVQFVHQDKQLAKEAAQICNQCLSEIIQRYPDLFYAIAILPTNNLKDMMDELQSAILRNKLHGVLLFVGPEQKPLDHPDYHILLAEASHLDIPVYIHPCRMPWTPDIVGEKRSKYMIWQSLGWVYDTSVAMVRLAMTGVFEKYPNLKVVTHHHGAMIPIFSKRMDYSSAFFLSKTNKGFDKTPSHLPSEHLHLFYCDTATHSYEPQAIKQAVDFFSKERVLFGTDAPMDEKEGDLFIENSKRSVEDSGCSESVLEKIRHLNAIKLFERKS